MQSFLRIIGNKTTDSNAAHTSKSEQKHHSAEQEYKMKLCKELYFSFEAIEAMKAERVAIDDQAKPYEELYKWASWGSIAINQQLALDACKPYGLTEKLLSSRRWFQYEHGQALIFLITKSQYSLRDALIHLHRLNHGQAAAIAKGTPKQELINLNDYQARTIGDLRTKGIIREDLLGKDWFNSLDHCCAMEYLTTTKSMSVEQALAEIDGMSMQQANAINKGYPRASVIKLNDTQAFLVATNDKYKPEQFFDKPWFNSDDHVKVHAHFVHEEKLTADKAFDRISGLRGDQAIAVRNGFKKSSVQKLTPTQLIIYVKYKAKGLDSNKLTKHGWLQDQHLDTLENYINNQKMKPEDAIITLHTEFLRAENERLRRQNR